MRLVLADDAVLFREGLARMLSDAGHDIAGQATDADELIEMVARLRPDAAITDIRMPPTHTGEGLVAAMRIRAEHPDVAILVLSQYIETHHALKLIGDRPAGVGYLLKDRVTDPAELEDALQRITDGGSAIDPTVIGSLMTRARRSDPMDRLSEREREVLALMAEGRSNAAIAETLVLTVRTVETHVRSIFTKLDLEDSATDHRRVLAVVEFLRPRSDR